MKESFEISLQNVVMVNLNHVLLNSMTKKGDFKVYTVREVVEEVFDSRLEISLSDALKISSAYELGDKIRFEESVAEFGRVAAQSAKQTIMEKNAPSNFVK